MIRHPKYSYLQNLLQIYSMYMTCQAYKILGKRQNKRQRLKEHRGKEKTVSARCCKDRTNYEVVYCHRLMKDDSITHSYIGCNSVNDTTKGTMSTNPIQQPVYTSYLNLHLPCVTEWRHFLPALFRLDLVKQIVNY